MKLARMRAALGAGITTMRRRDVRVTGQVVGTENRAGTRDRRAWLRISCLVILAGCVTAIVASRSIEVSQLYSRLSPPLYDDVSYFLDAVR